MQLGNQPIHQNDVDLGILFYLLNDIDIYHGIFMRYHQVPREIMLSREKQMIDFLFLCDLISVKKQKIGQTFFAPLQITSFTARVGQIFKSYSIRYKYRIDTWLELSLHWLTRGKNIFINQTFPRFSTFETGWRKVRGSLISKKF